MKFYIVDVFAQDKYQGNQLAVLIPDCPLSDEEMQKIALEINFSETTFILSGKQENGGYKTRIFTPDLEVPFAGHPTLGTAYVIHRFVEGREDNQGTVTLNFPVGPIQVTINENGLTMAQNQPTFEEFVDRKEELAAIYGLKSSDFDPDFPIQSVSTGLAALMVPLTNVEAIKNFTVDRILYQKFHDEVYRHNVMLFARDGDDIYARVIMPDKGVAEDPATGSANGDLAAYVLHYNYFGQKDEVHYKVRQGAEIGRPSLLHIDAKCVDGKYEILVGGQVYPVVSGQWL